MFWNKQKQTEMNTQELIAEIHDSFETAAVRLLKEAEETIATTAVDPNAQLKKQLGFSKAAGVLENDRALQTKKQSEDLSQLILYYQQAYPQYKFITETEVDNICNKYGLVYGEATDYIGDIPVKNLKEIETFMGFQKSIKPEDGKYVRVIYGVFGQHRTTVTYADYQLNQSAESGRIYLSSDIHFLMEKTFKICAPLSDMDMTGKELKGNRVMEIPVPDPVVIYPVRGGGLIVSKWGLEGEDPALTNEKLN